MRQTRIDEARPDTRGDAAATLTLDPRRVRRVLLVTVTALFALTLIATSAEKWSPGSTIANGLELVDASREASMAAFVTALLLLACAVLAAAVATVDAGMAGRWRLLALVLTGLALDEAIALHERTASPIQRLLDTGGFLYLAWVIPGMVLVIAFTMLFAALPARLPRPQRRLFVAAAVVFFGGAIGFEMVEGWVVDSHDGDSIALIPLVSVEETLEMVGVVLMLYVLMLRLAPGSGTVRLTR